MPVAAVGWYYLQDRVDEEIRCDLVKRLTEHYPNLKVTVRSAELIPGEGIRIRDLKIVEPGAEGPRAELIRYDEIHVACNTQLNELATGQLHVSEVVVQRPTLRVTRRPDGSWSAAKLLPMPELSDTPPRMRLEHGTIEIFDPLKNPSSTLTLRDVTLTLDPPDPTSPTPTLRAFRGTVSGDYLRHVAIQGTVDTKQGTWSVAGLAEGMDISPDLCNALPGPVAEKLTMLGELRGQGTLSFRLAYDAAAASALQFDLVGRLQRGRIDDPRLPYPLTDLRASVRMNNAGFAIDEFSARSGQATVRMTLHQAGFAWGTSPVALWAEVRGLQLDAKYLRLFPARYQEHWYKYRPAGEVDIDLKLAFDQRRWRPEAQVRCVNVSFTHHKFPYRLEGGKGSLTLKDDTLQLHLIADGNSQPIRVDAELQNVQSQPYGWVEVKGDQVPLDKKLLMAVPEQSRPVLQSLNPSGTIGFYFRSWRKAAEQPMRKHLVVDVRRCALRYEKFPYALQNIRGTIEMIDDNWSFRQLEGSNDTARVTCEGYFEPVSTGKELFLRFVGTDVPLDTELRDALQPNVQRVWTGLKPRGTADLVAEVRYLTESKQLSVGVRAEPNSETASVEPEQFPYRLENLQGVMIYRDGLVELKDLRAEHGAVRLAANGRARFLPDGTWDLRLTNLTADRLHLGRDRELTQAMPVRLRRALTDMNATGPVQLRGTLSLEGAAVPSDPLLVRWDVAVGFQQARLECGVLLENVSGEMTLIGQARGSRFFSQGELAIDSLTYQDYQVTQIGGPIWIDDQRVLLGSWVAQRNSSTSKSKQAAASQPAEQPRPLTGRLFDGAVMADGWVALGAIPRYRFTARLVQADLSRCAQEVMTGRQNLRGKVFASVDLRGSGRSINGLGGVGRIQLRDADIYELPVMISLLKILSIREPDRTAFSEADIGFRIDRNHLIFNQINFSGDAISLEGWGELSLPSEVDLTFRAQLGRPRVNLPVLREVMGGASEQIMLIHVDGTLHDPQTRKEAFPGVNQALQQLQRDLQLGPSQSAPAVPPVQQALPSRSGPVRIR